MKTIKLTAKQEHTLHQLKNASPIFKLNGGNTPENLFINGESTTLEKREINGNKVVGSKGNAIQTSPTEIKIEGHTATIKALEKKGLLTIVEIGGTAWDTVILTGEQKEIKSHNQLSEIEITDGEDTIIIHSPIGEEEIALKGYNELRDGNYKIKSIVSVNCEMNF